MAQKARSKRASGVPGKAGIRDLRPPTIVVVRAAGLRPGAPVMVDGRNAMRLGRPALISVGEHEFAASDDGRDFSAIAFCEAGHSDSDPFVVTLAEDAAAEGARIASAGKAGTKKASASTRRATAVPDGVMDGPTEAGGLDWMSSGAPRTATKGGGAAPAVQTVVYVHGIGNKPIASVLKCQWDTALFRTGMGDRTRMAYWVNRTRYPEPVDATCAARDSVTVDDDQATTAAIMALSGSADADQAENPIVPLQRQIDALTKDEAQRRWINSMARQIMRAPPPEDGAAGGAQVAGAVAAGASIRVLPLPEPWRTLLAAKLTRAFAPDVHDFLFVPDQREAMTNALAERLATGGGPFAVVAHSQGSMVAYEVLRTLTAAECDVQLLVTIGSPLGMQEVQDFFLARGGALRVPECVRRWVNVADRLDPVAIDPTLDGEYAANSRGVAVEDVPVTNPDSPRHPHSGTGYLRTQPVREAMIRAAGGAFAQPVGDTTITSDVVERLEDDPEMPLEVLIELADQAAEPGSAPRPLLEVQASVQAHLDGMNERRLREKRKPIVADLLQRFVAADLTRREIEELRTRAQDVGIRRVWRNSMKRTMIAHSAATVQATTANLGYQADGRDIGWAVVDTGIAAGHPHFAAFQNVQAQWDCLKPGKPRPVPNSEGATLDGNGHGTHVAGIIAGRMKGVALRGRSTTFAGMAPAARLYGFRALDAAGRGRDASIIKALEQIATINDGAGRLLIHGVNLSLGSAFDPRIYGCGHTPLCEELRRLWRQGVLVCLAAGNEGFATLQAPGGPVEANLDLTIGDPANLDEAIAVGSVHKENPHTYGISYFSSRGPTADGRRKPDLVAPGEHVLSALHRADQSLPAEGADAADYYVEMSGTSMAAPHVSGILAAFLSVRREFIGYPERVKRILLESCTSLDRDPYAQGAGLANLVKMLVST